MHQIFDPGANCAPAQTRNCSTENVLKRALSAEHAKRALMSPSTSLSPFCTPFLDDNHYHAHIHNNRPHCTPVDHAMTLCTHIPRRPQSLRRPSPRSHTVDHDMPDVHIKPRRQKKMKKNIFSKKNIFLIFLIFSFSKRLHDGRTKMKRLPSAVRRCPTHQASSPSPRDHFAPIGKLFASREPFQICKRTSTERSSKRLHLNI